MKTRSNYQTIAYRGGFIHLCVDEYGRDEVRVSIHGRSFYAKSLHAAKIAITRIG